MARTYGRTPDSRVADVAASEVVASPPHSDDTSEHIASQSNDQSYWDMRAAWGNQLPNLGASQTGRRAYPYRKITMTLASPETSPLGMRWTRSRRDRELVARRRVRIKSTLKVLHDHLDSVGRQSLHVFVPVEQIHLDVCHCSDVLYIHLTRTRQIL